MSKDFPDNIDEQVSKLKRMREEGLGWRDTYGANWDRNVSTMRGDLWPDKASRPLFLANIISPAIRRKAGLLTEAQPGIDIRPTKKGLQVTADVLKHTIQAIWSEQNVSMGLETLANYLAAFGCGFWKITYDPSADFGAGNICITDVDPRLVVIDPTIRRAVDLWQAQYIIEDSVVPFAWVKKRFPKTAGKVEPDVNIKYETNDTHKISWYSRIRERIKKQANPSDSAIPRCYLQQFWVADWTTDKDGNLAYPGGRRIWLTGDDVVLNPSTDPTDTIYGQNNPNWDGLFPYLMLDNEADLDHPFGHAEVEALRKINEAFNAVGHMTTRTMIKNVPWVIADQGSIPAATIQDLKELEEVVVEKAPGRNVERQPPTQPTTTNLDFMRLMITLVEMSAGLNDGAMQGKGRVELRSAPQLEGLQQAAQVLIRAQARRLENMLERAGQLLISRIFQFYTDDRLMVYNDGDKLKQYDMQKEQLRGEILAMAKAASEEEAVEETNENLAEGMSLAKGVVEPELTPEKILDHMHGAWKLFRFKVIPFSTLSSNKTQRAAMLMQLAEQGIVPMSMVAQEAGFDNPEELMAQAAKEMQAKQQMGFPAPEPKKKGGKK